MLHPFYHYIYAYEQFLAHMSRECQLEVQKWGRSLTEEEKREAAAIARRNVLPSTVCSWDA